MKEFNKIFEKFTTHAKNILLSASAFAKAQKAELISPNHILEAILREKGSLAYNLLVVNGVRQSRKKLQTKGKETTKKAIITKLDDEAKNIIIRSATVASLYEHSYIGTEHILFALIEKTKLLEKNKNYSSIKKQVAEIMGSLSNFQNIQEAPENLKKNIQEHIQKPQTEEKTIPEKPKEKYPALSFFCEDLNKKILEGRSLPVYGRQKEIERISNILSRKLKNNPLLIGEAGVGKTAIVHGLCELITKKDVPASLLGKKIFSVDMGLLVAGTSFRGEFEARLKDILEEAEDKDVVLFIDEIHTIVGAGSASGSLDAANMIKPALSSGKIRVIAATTPEEYKTSIEKDAALARRFHPVLIKEESSDETLKTMLTLKDAYQNHHSINISNEAIKYAILYSDKYFPNRKFPDKALDLLDEASAYLRNMKKTSEDQRELSEILDELESLKSEKNSAILNENYKEGTKLKTIERFLEKEADAIQKEIEEKSKVYQRPTLKKEHIEKIISKIFNQEISDEENKKKFLGLKDRLLKKIIGQDDIVKKSADTIARAQAGLRKRKRPLASFIFLGPSGVGKTELAKALAGEVFSETSGYHKKITNFIRIDMSEFAEPHSVSRLLGSPPGYIGFEEGGFLTERVKNNPRSLVLFDEIEKAHPQIFNILLQILDEGVLTDSNSNPIDFKNTIIVMTSNVGNEEFNKEALGFFETKKAQEDFERTKEKAKKSLKEIMRPELLNRTDYIFTFTPLSESSMEKIAEKEIAEFKKDSLESSGIHVSISKDVPSYIAKISKTKDEGARPIKRKVEEEIESAIAHMLFEGTIKEDDKVKVSLKNGKLDIRKSK